MYRIRSVRPLALCAGLIGLLAMFPAAAEETSPPDLKSFMRVKHCELCHDITERRVAPPFRMIALFYAKADREAIAKKLEKKIVHGGGGTWGAMPMPPNPQVSEAEAQTVVNWILDLKRD